MGMFDGYENLAENYVPNNLKPSPSCPPKKPCTNIDPITPNKPFEERDIQDNLVGYWWYYGNTLNLEFNIEQEVVVGEDKYIPAEAFMIGMKPTATIKLYNFRRECIHTLNIPNVETTTILLPINEELSKELVQGTYYCSLTLSNEDRGYNETILKMEDCTLVVK